MSTDTESDVESDSTDKALQEIRGEMIPDSQEQRQHFFVPRPGDAEDENDEGDDQLEEDDGESCGVEQPLPPSISSLLELPEIPVRVPVRRGGEPLIDYSQSLLLTSEEYIVAMQKKADRREAARIEAEQRRHEAERRKVEKQAEKKRKEVEKLQHEAEKQARKEFRARWSTEAIRSAGTRLQELVKNPPPRTPTDYVAPFLGNLPAICKTNMALRLAKRRAKRAGNEPGDVADAVAPPWVYRPDPRFTHVDEGNGV